MGVALVQQITSPSSQQIWQPQDLTGWTIRAAIGQIGVQPVAGTFTLTYEASDTTTETTAPLPFNATATQIQTALNAGAKMTAAGGCVVTYVSNTPGFFFVTFNTPNPQNPFTGDADNLAPLSLVEIGMLITGSSAPALQCVQTIRILQNPASFADLTTASPAAAINVTALQTGAAGPPAVNARYQVAFNQPAYGGQWSLTIAGIESALVAYNVAAADLQTALENIQQVSGTLVTGQRYVITTFVTGDVFTNVGAADTTGAVFTATGTTPTTWTHGSVLTPVGVGNVSVAQNSDGSFVIGFQAQMAGINIGTITGDATSLQVIPYLSGTLSLATAGMQLLLGAAASVNAIFEIEGTPSGGSPQKLFRGAITINASVIDPSVVTPTPIASFYTTTEAVALFGQLATDNTWLGAFNGLTISTTSAATLTMAAGKALTIDNTIEFAATDGNKFTFPAYDATLATLAGPEALTNKTINGVVITATTGTLTIDSGKTFRSSVSVVLAGTDGTTMTFPSTSGTVATIAATQTLTGKTISGASNTLSNIGWGTLVSVPTSAAGFGITDGATLDRFAVGLNSSTPMIAVGAGAGTGATASVVGNDVAGIITVNAGTTPTSGGVIATITFAGTYATSPLMANITNNSSASSTSFFVTTSSTNFLFTSRSGVSLAASTTQTWSYLVIRP